MKSYFIKNKNILAIAVIGAVILLFTIVHLYSDKSFVINNNDFSNLLMSLNKGDYTVSVTYSSDSDVYMEGFYSSNDQEYILFGTVLPASDTKTTSVFPLNIKHAIRNDSVSVRLPELPDSCSVDAIRFHSAFPLTALISLLCYLIFSALLFFFSESFDTQYYFFLTAVSLFLEPLFLVNPVLLPVFYILALLISFLIYRGKITVSENSKIFGMFLLFSFLLLEFFSTSSPLYALNGGCDSNCYYTVASALAHGRNLYTEVFDHKGPVLFVIFLIGYILSSTTFYGVWLLEVLALTFDFYFIYKICSNFMSKKPSVIVSLLSSLFILMQSSLLSGATCEEFTLPLLLWAFAIVLPFVTISEENKTGDSVKAFFFLGLLSSLVFFIKFNLSVMWMVISFILWLSLIKKTPIKNAVSYCIGWIATTLPIVIYFLCTDGLRALYHYYVAFNMQYGEMSTLHATLSRTVSNIFSVLTEHYINALFILVGITVLCASKKILSFCGKLIVVLSFVVLCGVTYAGSLVCNYYYTLPAAFAVCGIGILVYFISEKIESCNSVNPIIIGMAVTFGVLFYFNSLITSSILMDLEPKVQEIFSQQMDLLGDEDKSFFELGFLESGFFPVADQYPTVQFFYLPNNAPLGSESYAGQISYLDNANTEFFIWAGCGAEDYPSTAGIDNNYKYVCTYRNKNDVFYMLYKRN